MTSKQKAKLIKEARELGISEIVIDGVTYKLGHAPKQEMNEADLKNAVKFQSPLDDLSDTEVLFYHSPYFDELQEQTQLRKEQIKNKEDING